MGQIGRFIDKACREHPALMRRVLDRPFGTLTMWVDFDEEGEACGCLIGTIALVAGVNARRAFDDATIAIDTVAEIIGEQPWQVRGRADSVGLDVARAATWLAGNGSWPCHVYDTTPESEARTAEMLKRRIARRLGVIPAGAKAPQAAAEVAQ